MIFLLRTFTVIYLCSLVCWARIHNLEITNDVRRYIALTSFGFYRNGELEVELFDFTASSMNDLDNYGFSLDRTKNDGIDPYQDGHLEQCVLEDETNKDEVILFKLDLKNEKLRVECKNRPDTITIGVKSAPKEPVPCKDLNFDMTSYEKNGKKYFNTSFIMLVANIQEEGLYNLFFHNCPNYKKDFETTVSFNIKLVESNPSSYLSAGDMPLPALYCMMSILFFLSGMFWVFILNQSKHPVFKIHYMMTALVFLKAMSLAFHGINYHYIDQLGIHLATWAILFYIAHLLKGALLFVVLVLVGTGWTFIKNVLSPRDKKLFMVVIPLQVLANVAGIILEESEEGAREYVAWRNFVILVDIACCFCILLPVVWSIRYLREASKTYEDASHNLKKLELFRHFYVMIVCYIYSTRIIVYLLKITVPFQYGWLHEMFHEMATYVFFVLTAYKFRPASRNPYFTNSDDEDDDDTAQVISESGVTENLKRISPRTGKVNHLTITEVTEEEKDSLLGQKESSHEYD